MLDAKQINAEIRKAVGIKPIEQSTHYLGLSAKRYKNSNHIHIVHRKSNKALCRNNIKILSEVDLVNHQNGLCEHCLKIYNAFNKE